MKQILALAIKDLRLLLRDKAGFFFTFFFPLLIAVFFGTIFSGSGGGDGGISILVVDEDQTEESQAFIQTLTEADELTVRPVARAEAEDMVRRGQAVAYVMITEGFGEARQHVFWGEPPRIELGVDPARRAEAGMLQGILTKYAVQGFQRTFTDRSRMQGSVRDALSAVETAPDMGGEQRHNLRRFLGELDIFLENTPAADPGGEDRGFQGFEPLRIEKKDVVVQRVGPTNSFAVSFPQGMIWGILGCAAAFGISLVTERRRGTLVRLRMAPLSRFQILAGKAGACFLTTVGLSVGLFMIGCLVFGVAPHSYFLLGLAIVSSCLAFVGIMMLLSVLGKTEQSAAGIGWAVLLVMAMLGGGMIPLFIMPAWMRTVSHVSPIKWSMLALEGAIWRQFSLAEMLLPCGILVLVGVVLFAVGVRLFRWSVAG
ncbi:MAG: ABC transporter permease [Acidobacteria bacterium]|nr:ABC transporter permease [Acidobacteriota bacterium]